MTLSNLNLFINIYLEYSKYVKTQLLNICRNTEKSYVLKYYNLI